MSTPKTKTLYDLSADLERIAWELEASGGEVSEVLDEYLTQTELAVADKVANYVSLIRNFDALAEAKSKEAARLAASAKADKAIVSKLRARLAWFFEHSGLKSLRTRLGTVSLVDNPPPTKPMLLVPESEVPETFMVTRTIVEPDWEAIRAHLQCEPAGTVCKWFAMPERGKHINIR